MHNYETLLRKAKSGDSKAMFDLAMTLASEATSEREVREVYDWMERSAEAGNPDAMYEYGNRGMQAALSDDDRVDFEVLYEAKSWLEKASALGHARSQGRLGILYLGALGLGIPKDINKAITLLTAGMNGGCTYSKAALAKCYATGTGVIRDMSRAMQLANESLEESERANDSYGVNLARMAIIEITNETPYNSATPQAGSTHGKIAGWSILLLSLIIGGGVGAFIGHTLIQSGLAMILLGLGGTYVCMTIGVKIAKL